jgi:hypothetical protein
VAEAGDVVRFVSGNSEGWEAEDPGDLLLRDEPRYSLISSGDARRTGLLFAYDAVNARIVAFNKADGTYHEQYRLADGNVALASLRAMYVVAGAEGEAPELWWIGRSALHRTLLEPVDSPGGPSLGPSGPAGSPAASPSGGAGSGAPPP